MKIRNEQDRVTSRFDEELRQFGIVFFRMMGIFGILFLTLGFSNPVLREWYPFLLWFGGLLYLITIDVNRQEIFRMLVKSIGSNYSYDYNRRISDFFQRAFERGERHFQSKGIWREIGLLLASLVGLGVLGFLMIIPIQLIWGIFSQFLIKDLTDFFQLGMPAFVLFVWWVTVCGVRLVRLFIELTGFSYRLLIRPPIKLFQYIEDKVAFPIRKS